MENTTQPPHRQVLPALALLVGLLAAVAVALCWKQLKNEQMRAQSHVKELQTNIKQSELQLQNINLQLSNMQTMLQRQQAEVTNTQNTLQHMTELNPTDMENHILLEAEYLIRQAGLNLNFVRNVPAAIMLLQAADHRVQTVDDPGLVKVRQALANSIAALQALPVLDIEGLLTRLEAIRNQVDQLALFTAPKLVVSLKNDQSTTNAEMGWRKALMASWQSLEKLIVIRHRDEPIIPLLAPDQEIYLKQNLQLLLQKAGWAAMNNQPEIYQASLQQASDWIKRYFMGTNPTTEALLVSLADLKKVSVKPTLPNISPALEILQQVLAQRAGKNVLPTHPAKAVSATKPLPTASDHSEAKEL